MLETQGDSGNPRGVLEIQRKLEFPGEVLEIQGKLELPGGAWNPRGMMESPDSLPGYRPFPDMAPSFAQPLIFNLHF